MWSWGKKEELINVKKIRSLQEQNFNRQHHYSLVCTACQKTLTNEESKMSGMGVVCLERSRFAEVLPRHELEAIEGSREPINKGLFPARTVILREKNEKLPRYVTVLSVTPLESLVLDRTEMRKKYEESSSMSEAIIHAIYSFQPIEGESVAPAGNPKDPEVMRSFKKFQKEQRAVYKERKEYLDSNPYTAYYNPVSGKNDLSDEQLASREDLLQLKISSPDLFQTNWSKARFHMSTWIYRLQNTHLSEAKLLASALQESQQLGGLELKDYGLVDS